MMSDRTIIVSDLHGYRRLLDDALADAGYRRDTDRLIVAGDLVDIGTDDCIAAAEAAGATILAGNHEVSAALGVEISPQNPDTPSRGSDFAKRLLSGEWPLAVAVEGWLVTHGGLSIAFSEDIKTAGGDAPTLAAMLNEAFRDELRRYLDGELSMWSLGRSRIVGSEFGPLWFRGGRIDLVPADLKQIVGHTPCELFSPEAVVRLAEKSFLLVDPGAHLQREYARPRYAVIEGGEARVVAGCLGDGPGQ